MANVRAVIFDVYGTLLEVGPAPADAEARWQQLWREFFHHPPRLTRLEFSVASNRVIARHHAIARARGITWPEVVWPSIVVEILPEVIALAQERRDDFIQRQLQTGHSTRMTRETAEVLSALSRQGFRLGIASNAQAYTVRELGDALAGFAMKLDVFHPVLRFWSYENGFSKPDPHVFQVLSARLEGQGISPGETMLVGDQIDKDIEPARKHGWQTWQLPSAGHAGDGPWSELLDELSARTSAAA